MTLSLVRWRSAAAPMVCAVAAATSIVLAAQQPGRPIYQTGAPLQPPDASRAAAPQPTGTGFIGGRVVDAATGAAVRRATVRLTSDVWAPRTTLSGDDGTFEFAALPAGAFTLTVSKAGFLAASYGQKHPGSGAGARIVLAAAQRLERLSLPIPRGGVITGTILDDAGEPAFNTEVHALRYAVVNGERTLVPAGTARADDRGVYRIPVLEPGTYVVVATPASDTATTNELDKAKQALDQLGQNTAGPGAGPQFYTFAAAPPPPAQSVPGRSTSTDAGPSSDYAPVYYPATTVGTNAGTIVLGQSEERGGVDLRLQLVPMGQLSGTVGGPDPSIVGNTIVRLIDEQALPGLGTRTTRPGPDGRFSFTGVPPGQYRLEARTGGLVMVRTDASGNQIMTIAVARIGAGPPPGMPPQPSPMWASAEVLVDNRVPAVSNLSLQPGMSVAGRIVFEGTGTPPSDLTSLRVLLVSTSDTASSATATVDADGQFKATGVVPGRYRIDVNGVRGWRTRSAEAAGRDTLDFPLEVKPNEDVSGVRVTLTDRTTELSGTLQDSLGRGTSDYTVIIFAADQQYWTAQTRRVRTAQPSTDGYFSFSNLPAGDYRIAAVAELDQDQLLDPAFLRPLMGASVSVTLNDGDRRVQDIRVTR